MVDCSCCFARSAGLAWVGVLASPLLVCDCAADAEDPDVPGASPDPEAATEPPGGAAETEGEEPGVGSDPAVFGSGVFWHPAMSATASPASIKDLIFMVVSRHRAHWLIQCEPAACWFDLPHRARFWRLI
jgi:hypothetical protein